MGKRKRVKLFQNNVFLVLSLFLGIVFLGQSFFKNSSVKVLGDHSDSNENRNENSDWRDNNDGNSSQNNNVSDTRTSTITTIVTDSVTATSVITVEPTITDVVVLPRATITQHLQGRSAVAAEDNTTVNPTSNIEYKTAKETEVFDHPSLQSGAVQTQTIYSTEKVIVYVPVSEKSVTEENKTYYSSPKRSVIKSIQNKIKEVSRGEFISKPSPSQALKIPLLREENQENNMLTGDIDIFYRLQGGSVVLAAQNSEQSILNIKEDDLRSAEVTLNKILDNKKVKLNVTSDNLFALVQDGVVVTTDSPVHVNIDSQKIFVETFDGKKELKVLPMQAIKEAVDLKSFEKLNKDSVPSLENYGSELSYKVVGDKTYNVFGLFKVTAKQNVYITTEAGEVIEGSQPLLTRIISLVSI